MDAKLKLMEVLQNNFQNVSAQQVETLLKNANALSRLNVKRCNEPFTHRDEQRETRLEKEIQEICATLNADVVFTYEPMSYAVFVHVMDESRCGHFWNEQHGDEWYGVGE